MNRAWTPPDTRDEVVDFIRRWSEKSGLAATSLIRWLDLAKSKFYEWKKRYGMVNEHNTWIPRDVWLEPWEKNAIVHFHKEHATDGYRRIAFMLMDRNIVAVSPSSVYRVLKDAGLLSKWNPKVSKKGTGFEQPSEPHKHWHIDVSYINIRGTFYYLCGVLDGYSRYLVHWEIRESMVEAEVETIIQRAREKFPEARPRIISDNGPQFMARDFKEFIRISGMTHVRTSPYYPQSNGKKERYFQTLKRECIRPKTPLSLEETRRVVSEYVGYYNTTRLHSAIGYVAPLDKLEGRAEKILAAREAKLAEARARRKQNRSVQGKENLTGKEEIEIVPIIGEMETSSAEGQLVRDSRLRFRQESQAEKVG